jgi:small conductance mechanosensitive channel
MKRLISAFFTLAFWLGSRATGCAQETAQTNSVVENAAAHVTAMTDKAVAGVTTMTDKAMNILEVYVIPFAWKLLAAALIFFIGKWVAMIISNVVDNMMSRTHLSRSLVTFTKNLVYYVIIVMVAIAALNKLGVETTSFVAIVGAAGLAIGLALQGSLSNFAAGVMLLIFQPFDIGDKIDGGGASGIVKEIQMFNTIIHTEDKKIMIVPNSKITGDKIVVYNKL